MRPVLSLIVRMQREVETLAPELEVETEEWIELSELLSKLVESDEDGSLELLFCGEDAVGCAGMIRTVKPETWMLCFAYVEPKHRATHGVVGGMMVERLLEYARAGGARRITARVAVGNRLSEELVRRIGFRPLETEYVMGF